jgi:hypothetical protein
MVQGSRSLLSSPCHWHDGYMASARSFHSIGGARLFPAVTAHEEENHFSVFVQGGNERPTPTMSFCFLLVLWFA